MQPQPNDSIEDQLTELGLLRLRGDGERKTNRAIWRMLYILHAAAP